MVVGMILLESNGLDIVIECNTFDVYMLVSALKGLESEGY